MFPVLSIAMYLIALMLKKQRGKDFDIKKVKLWSDISVKILVIVIALEYLSTRIT